MSVAELKLELIRAIDRMTEAEIIQLLRQVSHKERVSPPAPRLRFGALKGSLIYMAPDFDAPLEDFKEYME
jgi:hypothetical protein